MKKIVRFCLSGLCTCELYGKEGYDWNHALLEGYRRYIPQNSVYMSSRNRSTSRAHCLVWPSWYDCILVLYKYDIKTTHSELVSVLVRKAWNVA